jgi:signal transduction histidine kinase
VVLDAPGEVRVAGVAPALRRAVTALVDNALDHAVDRVDVRVGTRRGTATVTVADDGPGIEEGLRPHVFERFTSGRPAAAPSVRRHYGIGLALVADVAAAHDGSVSAADRQDGSPGAVLTLALPVVRGSTHRR